MFAHQPVLLNEVLAVLAVQPGEICVDATVGGGGHARRLAECAGSDGMLIGLDQDEMALAAAEEALTGAPCRVKLLRGNFRRLDLLLSLAEIPQVDVVLMDIGVSSHQLDEEERGFTYRTDAPLDMRMDRSLRRTAADLVRELSQEELTRIIREYGEERWAARIAEFIVKERQKGSITTTGQLVQIIKAAVPAGARREGPHPARRTFQALRIAVNEELDALSQGLDAALKVLRPGGRLAVITFHSLEDRIVKERFRDWARDCTCPKEWPVCQCGGKESKVELITRKPLLPSKEELAENPRARSAKLRAVRKR
ncbi:MAG TPA: 16S rRNA (cytosine(1402)-N(4))-methyltransferase RsmH [Bacillota bacterium]|nr:16S rRNA (cytosine(1402)-N(4))-methyltransferase RsmH [Bacillota bacterium]